jgi:hypothetical protein
MISGNTSQRGFGHIGIIIAVVVFLAVGGLVAWRVLDSQKSNTTNDTASSIAKAIAEAKCEYDDKDLCKFFTSWKLHDNYKMVGTNTDKATGVSSTFTLETDGDKTHSILTGDFAAEIISIGRLTTYTKAADGTWWKQTLPETESPESSAAEESKPEFEEPTDENNSDQPVYKSLGKEACGKLTCFKYEVVDPAEGGTTSTIWFDTKDYQLRRSLSDNDDTKSDTTFSYDNVTVKAPETFKELAPNQYLMPGSSEPTTIPSAADFQQ